MTFTLRSYQQEAVTSTVRHFRQTNDPAVIVLPTGAGKSLVIAELARIAQRRILVLAHVKELVEQNHSKYEAYGLTASVFAAGLNRKESDHQVVFGSVQSVARNLETIGDEFSLVIIDECHRVSLDESSQYQSIITHLQGFNPELKVLGLTATPYRLDSGWIYQNHQQQSKVRTTEATPFKDCIYELPLKYMINHGYLTPARLLDAPVALYDFEQLRPHNSQKTLTEQELNRVLSSNKRATARVIEQVIQLAEARQGVMIFAATVAHTKEILSYLPNDCSAIILGEMKQRARDSVITAFKNRQIKFLVNVSVLTTGFDAPHVDLIAILRPTDSVGLYQQIVGRGLRLNEGKEDCLVLDYANNQYDLFQPEIAEPKPYSDSVIIDVPCPICNHTNQFWGKLDDDGDLIEHYGRRCQGLIEKPAQEKTNVQANEQAYEKRAQCDFRYRFKSCPQCNAENDIAAHQCQSCDHLLVDPDQTLKDALKLKDKKVLRCAGMSLTTYNNRQNEERFKITYYDEDGTELNEYYALDTPSQRYIFEQNFLQVHAIDRNLLSIKPELVPNHVTDALALEPLLRAPDFVIGQQVKENKKYRHTSSQQTNKRWQVIDKIFDYEGAFRRAHQLS